MRMRPVMWLLPAAILAALPLVRLIMPPAAPQGLTGRYYANDSWSGPPLLEALDREVSTAALRSHLELSGLARFTVEWTGVLVVREEQRLRFATTSDDGSWLWIDDQLIVDNGGVHAPETATGDIFLDHGVHTFRVRYYQAGGDMFLDVAQSAHRGTGVHPGPLVPEPLSYRDFRIREIWPLGLVVLIYAALVPGLVGGVRRLSRRRYFPDIVATCRNPHFVLVAALGVLIAAWHIDYGVTVWRSFSSDELMPLDTLEASRSSFRDWNPRWPSGHPTMLAIVLQPFVAASAWAGLPLVDPIVTPALLLTARAFSVLLLFLTFAIVFEIAETLADRLTATFAVALLALAPVVVYFGPFANLETPHLFWVTLTWWMWINFWRRRDLGSALAFGAAVGMSLGVKDQAYGYYIAAPVAALAAVSLRDRSAWAMGLAALGAFALAQGIPWAWDRFVAHVQTMTGETVAHFQMFPRTRDGYVQMLAAVGKTFVWGAGVPLAAAFFAGCIDELIARRGKQLVVLLVPLLTYIVGFLFVTMYVYDRFLIAGFPIAAFIGGRFLRNVWQHPSLPMVLRFSIPAALVALGTVNAIAQNRLFASDARYGAADWIARNMSCGVSVGVSYDTAYVPPLGCFDVWLLLPNEVNRLTRWPEYLVFNELYVRRFMATDGGSQFLKRLVSGDLGYRLAYRSEAKVPRWAPLLWEQRFTNDREDPETMLDKPINAIQVWRRQTE